MFFSTILKPAWRHKDPKVRERSLHKISDPEILLRIIQLEQNRTILEIALGKIKNEIHFAEIAQSASINWIRQKAISHVVNEDLLAQIAINAKQRGVLITASEEYFDIRILAIEKIQNPEKLFLVAANAQDWEMRIAAIRHLTNLSQITLIQNQDPSWHVKQAAAYRIKQLKNSPAFSQKISDPFPAPSFSMEGMVNHNTVVEMEKKEFLESFQALQSITNPALLNLIAQTDENPNIRKAANQLLGKKQTARKSSRAAAPSIDR